MLYKKISLLALAGLLAIAGCTKETPAGGGGGLKSSWSFNGVTYTEGSTPTSFSSGSLSASDNVSNGTISIEFGSRPAPGTYSTTDLSDTSILPSNNCSIDLSTVSKNYKSSGSGSGGSVSVSESGGKLTATFTNIEMEDISAPSTKKSLSGTLIEK